MQVQAISIMNALMGGPAAEALPATISGLYREGLFGLARDTSSEVRRGVCSGIILLLTLQPEAITSEFSSIVEYMLLSCQVLTSPSLLEACFAVARNESIYKIRLVRQRQDHRKRSPSMRLRLPSLGLSREKRCISESRTCPFSAERLRLFLLEAYVHEICIGLQRLHPGTFKVCTSSHVVLYTLFSRQLPLMLTFLCFTGMWARTWFLHGCNHTL